MWIYTTFILYAYVAVRNFNNRASKPIQITFNEFADFVFGELWRKHGIVFHDSKEDLERDIQLLAKLEIIEYNGPLKNITINLDKMKTLESIGEGMRKDPMRQKIPIVDEYLRRIEATITPHTL